VVYYTVQEAAILLGVAVANVMEYIAQGIIQPLRSEGARKGVRWLLTPAEVDTLDDLIDDPPHSRTVVGIINHEKNLWYLGVRPEIFFALDPVERESMLTHQNIWAEFLNGRWVKDKPNFLGPHLVQALDDGSAQYRTFRSMAEVEAWMGWFWSETLPQPPKGRPCT